MSLRGALFATTLAPHAVQVNNLLKVERLLPVGSQRHPNKEKS